MFGFDANFNIQMFDFGVIWGWLELPFFQMYWQFFSHGVWLVFFIVFLHVFKMYWMNHIWGQFYDKQKFVLLAVDVPKESEQTPKAVENVFAQVSAISAYPTFFEKYWDGHLAEKVSFEIVSIDGYVQFLVRCNARIRDLLEAALYAEYPDLEITEVSDYVDDVPHEFPDENYDMFGTELILARPSVYPLRTYEEFEHKSAEEAFKDPLALLLEDLSRLQVGEQVWLQIVVEPPLMADEWQAEAKMEIKKVLKQAIPYTPGIVYKIITAPFNLIIFLFDQVTKAIGVLTPTESAPEKEQPFKIMNLTPGERTVLEAMEKKISKTGFLVKIRVVYIARKEIFSKVRGFASVIGAMKQFNTLNLNAFRPDFPITTKVRYLFKALRTKWRKNRLMLGYIYRSAWRGSEQYILNTEELASIYHFPALTVKAPLLKRTTFKRSEPPVDLPSSEEDIQFSAPKKGEKSAAEKEEKTIHREEELAAKEKKVEDYFSEEDLSDDVSLPTGLDKK